MGSSISHWIIPPKCKTEHFRVSLVPTTIRLSEDKLPNLIYFSSSSSSVCVMQSACWMVAQGLKHPPRHLLDCLNGWMTMRDNLQLRQSHLLYTMKWKLSHNYFNHSIMLHPVAYTQIPLKAALLSPFEQLLPFNVRWQFFTHPPSTEETTFYFQQEGD